MSIRDAEFHIDARIPPPGLRGYSAKMVSDQNGLSWPDEGLVHQAFAVEVDINTIVKRFGMTGNMPSGVAGGVYGDFTGISDYESAVEAVERARTGFMKLPPDVRERFKNDPGELIYFAQSVSEDEFMSAMEPSAPPPAAPAVPPPAEG